MASCKKWLDITPQSQVSLDDLYKTPEGFEEALNGVYIRCAQSDIYGDELSCGFLDVMAQDYTTSALNDALGYTQTQRFNYQDANFMKHRDSAWGGLYNAIVNTNLILSNIDAKKNIFKGNEYSLIKGEALALRGFLHFDLFRMFGSSLNSPQPTTGIPYVTKYTNTVTAMNTPAEVMFNILADLNGAKDLLKTSDPILSNTYVIAYPNSDSSTEASNDSLFLQNRRYRLNYFAVCGELARVYLYQNDKTNALANAKEVIDSKKFPWTAQADFLNTDAKTKDPILYKELLFSWYCPWETKHLHDRFLNNTSGLYLSQADAQYLYETNGVGGEDFRYKQWLTINSSGNMELQKYARNAAYLGTDNDQSYNLYPQAIPSLRLSEMYYIAAEASYDANPTSAIDYLNKVRNARGIGASVTANTKSDFTNELLKDARKELLGEGQIFYMYKRLYHNIVGQNGAVTVASDKIFTLPLPVNEIQFGNR